MNAICQKCLRLFSLSACRGFSLSSHRCVDCKEPLKRATYLGPGTEPESCYGTKDGRRGHYGSVAVTTGQRT